jgi:hypothetical protein
MGSECGLKAYSPGHFSLIPAAANPQAGLRWDGPVSVQVEVGLQPKCSSGDPQGRRHHVDVSIDKPCGCDLGSPTCGHPVQRIDRDSDADPNLAKPGDPDDRLDGVLQGGVGPGLLGSSELAERIGQGWAQIEWAV